MHSKKKVKMMRIESKFLEKSNTMCGNTSEYKVNNKVQIAEKVSETFFFCNFTTEHKFHKSNSGCQTKLTITQNVFTWIICPKKGETSTSLFALFIKPQL